MIPLYDTIRTRTFPVITVLIIALNLLVFASWQRRVGLSFSAFEEGIIPRQLTGGEGVTQEGLAHLFTYMFMHGSWLHLLGNLWFLWIFGNNVEEAMGGVRFLIFYLCCGVAAGLAHVLFSRGSNMPLIGASGAISGVLGAYLVLYPRARIVTLVPIFILIRIIAVPAWVFLLIWIGLQVFAQAAVTGGNGAASNVAYMAHIGGFAAGLALIWVFRQPPQRAA